MPHIPKSLLARTTQAVVFHVRHRHTTGLGAAGAVHSLRNAKSNKINNVSSRSTSTAGVKHRSVAHAFKTDPYLQEEAEWLWPVDDTQMMFVAGHDAGARHSGPFMTLNSAAPLKIEDFEEALFHLHRKTPIYQVCMNERNGRLWWQKRNDIDINFKVLERGTDSDAAVDDMWGEGFERGKSLWKARLVPADIHEPCPMPELKSAYPYQYNFMTCTHHAIGDGMSIAPLCQAFLNILNAIIDGRQIDDKPLGIFLSGDEIAAKDEAIRQQLLQDPDRFEALKAEVLNANKVPALLKAFPRPSVDKPTTKQIINNIDKNTHDAFAERCKAAGVSFGYGIQAAINTAMVEMVSDAGVDDEYHDISVNLATNLRRFLEQRPLHAQGLHARTMAVVTHTPKNTRERFWEYTADLHRDLGAQIRSGGVLQQEVVRRMVMPKVDPYEFYVGTPEATRDYGYSNLGDFAKVIPGTGKHVQMTDLMQYTAVHKFLYNNFHQLFTFRGRCKYSISYATDQISDETAQLLANKVMDVVKDVSK
ncbi:uncharacterized protein LOC122249292 isoform X2 [Penaeus japonicus]|uniref:uncharacterized protein LOC122249292 isoform X2 n=1 Tax=Penaeus japonicus TaxID=27405 RepID=UPI001C716EA3|nr:uncharacterized protein LOC122249292 isoform X2 [Penaeus japonicus]